jgi:Zn/Cd-binding protein ZinT
MLFENEANADLKRDLTELPQRIANPFKTLKRYIRWELMDLEAIIETVEDKTELVKAKNSIGIKLMKDHQKILKMKKGNYSMKSAFKSKQGKVNQLTEL